ncbi:MAG: sulfatase-like hydrolase/transferase [Deltaproteobacteria bacterium]|nr:sulfatase-like hydrolase/transferase [Deltaproteobacteria bacterium]
MAHRDMPHPSESDDTVTLSRRGFLKGGMAAAAAAVIGLHDGGQTVTAQSDSRGGPPATFVGRRPNFLILMCDEMRFPPVYESGSTKAFRLQYLKTQAFLRQNGVDFQRHYAASVACVPGRASIYTGQYPSLHGVTQTTGAAKESFDPDVFWLDPNAVPTLGDYFRAAGYSTFWRGKWHASDADMLIPGTHNQLLSYDSSTGAPDPARQALYDASDRLGRYGFSGWIGPEPHGREPLNSGSSVPPDQQGRDVGFAQQVQSLIRQLDRERSSVPWLVVSSFVNPHDITLWGLWANLGFAGGFQFDIEEGVVPVDLFDPVLFDQTVNDNLASKPSAQASYQASYAKWMQPILNNSATLERYYRYYYQLHKNVDEQMMMVLQALLGSRYKNDTIVVFTSDHGDLLGSHHGMHQKWYTAYEEAIRVPLIIWNKKLFPSYRAIDTLTSHIDLLPTLMGLAGIHPEQLREILAVDHSDARPLVGRDLTPLILGKVDPSGVNDPLYFMTDDDPSRGLNQDNFTGITANSVIQPSHIETVIARLDNGNVWKYSRYFDNPQFWSSPGTPGEDGVQDVILDQKVPTPSPPYGPAPIPYEITVKSTPEPSEFEMYNVTEDPMELTNLYSATNPLPEQGLLARLLQQQCMQKRLIPCSGGVPGQPICDQPACRIP